ncbi:Pre-mRNA-processing factor 39 [Hordeum vulgare]|nr:Pre-mRNA-processing factor 39 [Hordeum vulgare]
MHKEDQEAEAAYHTLAAVLRASEEETHLKKDEEEEAYHKKLVEAIALYVFDDCGVPPLTPPPPAEPRSLALKPKLYARDGVVREWISKPPVWLGATT